MCDDRHRHQEWLPFLRVIDQVTPAGKDLHLIADNHATHKHAKVQRWWKRHPRFFHVHFTPTSSSWLNIGGTLLLRRYAEQIAPAASSRRRGVNDGIGEYIDRHNQNPKLFISTAKASDILEKVKRARASLNNAQSV
jgi:hypothetical protein